MRRYYATPVIHRTSWINPLYSILLLLLGTSLQCLDVDACNVHQHTELRESPAHDDQSQGGLRHALQSLDDETKSQENSAPIMREHRCGTPRPTWDAIQESSRTMERWLANPKRRSLLASSVEIETFFHVISDGSKGLLSENTLDAQLAVMNKAYRPYGFSFKWMDTTRTNNSQWYHAKHPSPEQLEMKEALRRGDSATLNVYFSWAAGKMGYATSPQDYRTQPVDDGVVVSSNSVPGGSAYPYNEGMSLVHEIGHWLGLFHTFNVDLGFFQNINFALYMMGLRSGCDGAGDYVSDTPPQKTSTTGCPSDKNTCPSLPGTDAIHNYMDYSSDACMTEFTPGQADRMWAMWSEYRAVSVNDTR